MKIASARLFLGEEHGRRQEKKKKKCKLSN